MKIACLGWGSLIWDSRELNIQKEKWLEDGPVLPIEFSRISSDGRVTLVIDKQAASVNVLWAEMEQDNQKEAVCLLAKREGTKCENIHSVAVDETTNDDIKTIIINWLKETGFDAAIWTGLTPKEENSKKRPSDVEIVKHLKNLDECDKKRAGEYIRRAPAQITTAYRTRIEKEFGWTPIDC